MWILSVTLSAVGCQDSIDSGRTQLTDGTQEIHISLNVPGEFQSGLRSISGSEEKAITEVDVLAFDVNASSTTYSYAVTGSPSIDDAGKPGAVVTLKNKPGVRQQIVVITNAHKAVTALIAGASIGTAKTNLLNQLVDSLGTAPTKWNAAGAANFRAIPMWGESDSIEITEDLEDDIAVDLLRTTARIDVKLDTNVSGLASKFKIGAVYLYNTNTVGLIAPHPANVTKGSSGYAVSNPSIPAGFNSPRGVPAFIEYEDSVKCSPASFVGAIYALETQATAAADSAICLVVGGFYKTDSKMSFYRVDFYDTDGKTPIPVLRNRQYNFNITDVTSRGHDTKDEAFEAARRVEINVNNWGQFTIDSELSL
ncbi:hypothetical protein AGMMS49525_05550 [Bacteroidia bacterium]|nr:hypothetical protein AGMMS49525_05550 [Bacteroidia bacterium]